ncbi:DUF3237 family protein [Nesterenkonia sp. F]|uniref:DUF3237 family protein n=1 Tax=Nesterenkonia sp. F TaxID=795955 RepID=UPI000255D7B7
MQRAHAADRRRRQASRLVGSDRAGRPYSLETDDGAQIGVRNTGIRVGRAEDIRAIVEGEPVPPERIHFRLQTRFTTADPDLSWMNERLFVAHGTGTPEAMQLGVFRLD